MRRTQHQQLPIEPSSIVLSGEISRREARARARRRGAALQPLVVPVAPQPQQRPPYQPSVASRLPLIAWRLAWRYRWQLGVLGAVALVARAGAVAPVATTLTLAGVAGAAYWWARSKRRFMGRMLMSVRERTRAAWWAGAGSAWAGVAIVAPPPVGGAWWLLAVVVAVPSWQLAASRPPRSGTPSSSPWARDILRRWPAVVAAQRCPSSLAASTLDAASLKSPDEGTMTVTVHLAEGCHGRDVVDGATRRFLEAALELPVDTARLAIDRDHARRAVLTITRGRTLEKAPATWPGPVLTEDGLIPIALAEDGRVVSAALFSTDSVEHAFVSGSSGVGKSSTLAGLILPGVAEGLVTLWYVDGKGGGSAPYLRPACDWFADDAAGWAAVILSAHAVLKWREHDRGKRRGLWRWQGRAEDDPILRVVIDEGATIERAASTRVMEAWTELAEKGRSLGIALVHSGQSSRAQHVMGGAHVREQLSANGTVIAHRAGGGQQARLALDSAGKASVDIDLTELPPGPGWAAIVRKGEILAPRARVRFADGVVAGEYAQACTPRPLTGGDATAAGAAYANRQAPAANSTGESDTSEDQPAAWAALAKATGRPVADAGAWGPAVDVGAPAAVVAVPRAAARTDRVVLEHLRRLAETGQGPVPRRAIVASTGYGASTVARSLARMESEGVVCSAPGQRWLPGEGTT